MHPTDNITLRKWSKLNYRDPKTDLINLGRLQGQMDKFEGSPTVANLRRRDLRRYLEWRQAALFSYLMSTAVLDCPIAYAMSQDEDYDCVSWWIRDDKQYFTPIQLKEIVPKTLNPAAEIETELAKLEKYVTSERTVVAMHLNQSGRVEFSKIPKPKANCREIWLYGSITPDQSNWFLYGDLLGEALFFEVPYPTP